MIGLYTGNDWSLVIGLLPLIFVTVFCEWSLRLVFVTDLCKQSFANGLLLVVFCKWFFAHGSLHASESHRRYKSLLKD